MFLQARLCAGEALRSLLHATEDVAFAGLMLGVGLVLAGREAWVWVRATWAEKRTTWAG